MKYVNSSMFKNIKWSLNIKKDFKDKYKVINLKHVYLFNLSIIAIIIVVAFHSLRESQLN